MAPGETVGAVERCIVRGRPVGFEIRDRAAFCVIGHGAADYLLYLAVVQVDTGTETHEILSLAIIFQKNTLAALKKMLHALQGSKAVLTRLRK
jgi:hypothetical protein